MQATTLEGLFFHPVFLSILLTILITIGNVLIGVSILPKDKRKKRYILHRYVYWAVVISYCMFLVVSHFSHTNGILNYFTLLYFLIGIPASRKINVTLHAIISSVGLVLLVLVATLNL